ncbi:MAG: nucleoside-diphosphate kinase [Bacteroidales bacterium]
MERTLALIKPRAFKENLTGPILNDICQAGFRILSIKTLKMNKDDTESFYSIHKGKPFYKPLVEYMSSGKIVVFVLSKENAVNDFRKLLGPTDPHEAKKGSLREKYGLNTRKNAIHGSDSVENAEKEINFFFAAYETTMISSI